MRVIYATDGSTQAELAGELIAAINWPPDTHIRVVCAVDAASVFVGAPLAPAVPANVEQQEEELARTGQSVAEEARRLIAPAGVNVETTAIRERAGSAIVDEATDWKADLIVMGSRGHGEIASMVLGSVSAEVADHAPCPVLIARRPMLTRAVVGHDGSACAMRAESLLASWPIFERVAIEVVCVAPSGVAWEVMTQATYAGGIGPYLETVQATIDADREVTEAAARRLREAGRRATASVVQGAPATELIRVADERAADLVVIGTRGRTGVRRLLLGSVARNVLHHATCSVLIVR
jgi:nucleotide-binding universal stress UspA family protein